MWSRSTIAPSLLHTSCCFTRAWSSSCSMLKEIAAFDSLAENRFTGIETRPKEMVAVPFGLSAMLPFYAFWRDEFSTAPGVDCSGVALPWRGRKETDMEDRGWSVDLGGGKR